MTQQKKMQSKLTIVATAHNEPSYNRMFIDSMLNQTDQNFKAIVFHNGQNNELCDYIHGLKRDNILYQESETDTGLWGTVNRQTAIDECDTEYIIQTSIQDVWLPQSIHYINKTIDRTSVDIIYWDTINHIVGECKVLDGQLAWAHCDWGQFAIRTSIAKAVGVQRGAVYCGDWAFVEDCLNSGLIKTKCKLPLILNIHN